MKKRVKFMVTAFRDGFQSVYGARVFTKDFLPAVEAASAAGMKHFEAGGGARFQSLYFYCNEDAFDMMDAFRAAAGPDADLQTLARGVNVVGLDSQPSDVIALHAKLFKKHGISTIRNFDALNDVNNLIYSGQCIVDAGLRHEVCVTLMELPPGCSGAHTAEFYAGVLQQILDAGIPFDSVCFKDASGTAVPSKVYETIKAARKKLGPDVNITFHTHETAGISIVGYKAALDAGADQIDLSLAPASGGTCQPDVMTMWHALRGTDFDMGIDIDKVREASEVFKECMADYFMPPEAKKVEPLIPYSPMPGGALTANTQMMRDNNILDRYEEVVAAMGEVVERGGFGTSVTPVSQFYFQQAFNNVMFGPWKRFAEGYGKMVLGYFGKTPVAPDPEIVKMAQEQLELEPTTKTVLEINDADPKKGLKVAKALLEKDNLPTTDENLFIAATCKEKGIAYLKGEAKTGVRKISDVKEEAPAAAPAAPAPAPAAAPAASGVYDLVAHVNGTVTSVSMTAGAMIQAGATLFTLDAAGSAVTVPSPLSGKIDSVAIAVGSAVAEGSYVGVLSGGAVAPAPAAPAAPVAAPAPAAPTAPVAAPAPAPAAPSAAGGVQIKANLPGTVVSVAVTVGQQVNTGDILMIVESMKMEIEIPSTASGTVQSIPVAAGAQVASGDLLMVIA
ncbi:MAG: biotin/lipoyl-binding protein [Spirochaetales bacterium]|nr:biotin/lipoyl-binding protein [Spirochaetales bacterium]